MKLEMGNMLTSRLGEHLVCAELARRHLIATTFTHNVPKFDVLVTNKLCRTVPIQVKATNDSSWPFDADKWMDIALDAEKETQTIVGEKTHVADFDFGVCVAVKTVEQKQPDQFFILTEQEIQKVIVDNYRTMLAKCGGHRKRNWESKTFYWNTEDLAAFEDNWQLIIKRLDAKTPDQPI